MDERDDQDEFDRYVESLPTMLTLLAAAVSEERAPPTKSVQELRLALGAALAAAERLRHERRRKARQHPSKTPGSVLHLVT
jgi:hypothetical protein